MTTVTITRLSDIHAWPGDINSLIKACLEIDQDGVDAVVGSAAVSNTVGSYLHYEATVLPNYETMSGVPREVAEQMRLVWKPLRVAANHRVLRDLYTRLLELYAQIPETATGTGKYLKVAVERPRVVRLIEFGVAIHNRCHQLIANDPRSEKWRTLSRGLRVNNRTIPVALTADECYERMVSTLQSMLAD